MEDYKTKLPELIVRATVESALLLILLGLIFRYFAHKSLKLLGAWRLLGFLVFVLLWTGVHLLDRWQYFYPQKISFYPLTRFAMYQIGDSRPIAKAYDFVGIYRDGSERSENLSQAFRAVGLPAFSTRMRVLTRHIEMGGDKAEAAKREFLMFIQSYLRYLKAQDKELPSSIRVDRVQQRVSDFFAGKGQITSTPLYVWEEVPL